MDNFLMYYMPLILSWPKFLMGRGRGGKEKNQFIVAWPRLTAPRPCYVSVHQLPKYLQFPRAVEGVTSETVHVLSQVKKSENHVMFLLSNEETDRYFKSQRMALSKESASLRLLPLKPRLIEIQKGKSGYGFYLRMAQNTGGKNQVNTQTMTFAVSFLPI